MQYPSRCRNLLVLALLAAAPGAALAVEPLDRFSFSVGGFATDLDTRIRADGDTILGTPIDLSRDLGLDPDSTLTFVRVAWRPFGKHEFGLSHFSNRTNIDHRLEHDIVFEDQVYTAGATVNARYGLDSYDASYTWWAWSEKNWALGPRLGLTIYRVNLGLELALDVDGNPVAGASLSEKYRGDLPAPTLGAGWRWTPAEQWRISADVGWLKTTINNIDGEVGYARAAVEWYPWERVGLTLDYSVTDISASTERRLFTGHLDLRQSGTRLGLIYRF